MNKAKKRKLVSINDLALMVGRGFSEAKNDLDKFKKETEENFHKFHINLEELKRETDDNFHKVRHDILSMADSFVPRSEFETRMLKMHNAIQHQDERLSKFVDNR